MPHPARLFLSSRAVTRTWAKRLFHSSSTPLGMEQFCYKTELNECTVLENVNTDWSVSLTTANEVSDSQFLLQLFACLLSYQPQCAPEHDPGILLVPQGSLTAILPKESETMHGAAEVPLRREPNLALHIESHEKNDKWQIECPPQSEHVAECVLSALEEGNITAERIVGDSALPHPPAPSTHHIIVRVPSSSLACKMEQKQTAEEMVRALSHPEVVPFVTESGVPVEITPPQVKTLSL